MPKVQLYSTYNLDGRCSTYCGHCVVHLDGALCWLHRCFSTISTAANLPLNKMGEALKLRGVLSGHGGWITAIATTQEDSTMVLTASRDKVCRFNSILFLMYLTWLT